MRMRQFCLMLACSCLVGIAAGCSPDQIEKIDKVVGDVNTVADGLSDVASGPAGAVLPADVRLVMKLLGVSAAVALALWQRVRGKAVRRTGSAVVAAIESLPSAEKAAVKRAVKSELVKRRMFSKGNKVVEELKDG